MRRVWQSCTLVFSGDVPSRVVRPASLAASAAFIAVVLYMIWRGGLSTPMYDQWGFPRFLSKVDSATFSIGDVFAWHENTPHRPAVSRLLLTPVALATNWNMGVERGLCFLLGIVTLGACLCINARDDRFRGAASWLFLPLAVLFVFTPYSVVNWVWSGSEPLFFINACAVSAAALLLAGRDRRPGWRLLLAAFCCLLATYTQVHGILGWIALFPLVTMLSADTGQRRKLVVWWLLLFAAVGVLYSQGYEPHTDLVERLQSRFGSIVAFALLLLYSPVKYALFPGSEFSVPLDAIGGAAMLTVFALLAFRECTRTPRSDAAIAWMSLGSFAVLYAGMNALGRADASEWKSLNRTMLDLRLIMYSTPAALFSLALVNLAAISGASMNRMCRNGVYAVLSLLTVGAVLTLPQQMERHSQYREVTRNWVESCVELAAYWKRPDRCNRYCNGNLEEIHTLERWGLRRLERELEFVEPQEPGLQLVESVRIVEEPDPGVGILWGKTVRTLTGTSRNPEGVVLLEVPGERRFFAHGHVDDAGKWRVPLPAKELPERPVRVWLYSDRLPGIVRPGPLVELRRPPELE